MKIQGIDEDKIKRMVAIKEEYEAGNIELEEAKRLMSRDVVEIYPYELAYAEQNYLHKDENDCKTEDIKKMIITYEHILKENDFSKLDEYHPISMYIKENEIMKTYIKDINKLIEKGYIKNEYLGIYEALLRYRVHYFRKHNQLYAKLEEKGFDRPSKLMWIFDDHIRDSISRLYNLLRENEVDTFLKEQDIFIDDILDLMNKEETVLYPTSLKLITPEEFDYMKSGDEEIGYFEVTAPKVQENNKFEDELMQLIKKYSNTNADEELDVATGKLSLNRINLIFKHMPVDLSYVDENDIVKFYTDTKERIFPRSKNAIGREVRNCHPPKSVHIVEEIIQKFKNGEQEVAEFWINKEDLFLYIKYVAVREEDGTFRGILEMMQDCTKIRSLEGSRTLLTWDNEKKEEKEEIIEEKSETNDGLEITENTKIKDLINIDPGFKDFMISINPMFRMLKTPLARLMINKATIKDASERSGINIEELKDKIKERIKNIK